MALELVCGADFWCNRHCRTSPVVLEGFWGQVWPKIGRKHEKSEYRIANEPLRMPILADLRLAPDLRLPMARLPLRVSVALSAWPQGDDHIVVVLVLSPADWPPGGQKLILRVVLIGNFNID
jgi:hypothetical protein